MLSIRICLAVMALGLSACSIMNLERSRQSGYFEASDEPDTVQDYFRQQRLHEIKAARQELGIPDGIPLNEEQTQAVKVRLALKRLEERIPNELERRQYYELKPYFASDRQRIEFLQLPTREARDRYAVTRNIGPNQKIDPATQSLIDASDIAPGMSREAVKLSWGEPDAIEVAGRPLHGNERWVYRKLMSTEDGYRQETRMIYFESGRVTGWETE